MSNLNYKQIIGSKLFKTLSFVLISLYIFVSSVNAKTLKSAVSKENKNGFHEQIIKYISEELDIDIEILTAPLGRRLNMIEDGSLDLLVGLRKTPERESKFIFIEPSYTKGIAVSAFYVNSNKKIISSATKTRLIAIVKTSSYIKDYTFPFNYKIIEVVSLTQMIV